MSLQFLARAVGGVLERLYPTAVPPYVRDVNDEAYWLDDYEAEHETLEPPFFAGAAASLADVDSSPSGAASSFGNASVREEKQQPTESGAAAPHPLSPSGAVADDFAPPVSSPAPEDDLPSVEWLTPAVCEVLAEHTLAPAPFGQSYCRGAERVPCDGNWDYEWEWREHVAPIVAEHILNCIKSFQQKPINR